ncbi:serine/threonine protein kinase [Murinocardiopsis flavida]|uniref:Serine/threonine protein kinase n=1 Tax=Murinocardiopsis flavida TaxID=645275 RepID=A0A2P8DJI3_9ACTN|nr:serine/threonine-protein kinase [Murinocardiopsis flavida]PSK97348.1 serine/threonine protein kinase [Murinocardiopsis flavida]
MADIGPLTDDDPRVVGDYELLGRLGQGGQGVVYQGQGPDGGYAAVKMLHADALDVAGLRKQMAEEVDLARRVARFCTAQVLDADIEADPPYVVSEYIEGPSLHSVVRENGPISGAALERLAIGTVTALAAIHQAGIVHRDFKPGNVLMGPDGPRVIDFGIARVLEGTAIMTSRIAGTPAYMAPEQIMGGPLGPAVDMFAWGSAMVFAANGKGPFGHDSLRAVVNRVIQEPPDFGELTGPLREIAERCLSKDPADRPSASETLLQVLGVDSASAATAASSAEAPLPVETMVAGTVAAADSEAKERAEADVYRSFPAAGPAMPAPVLRQGPPSRPPVSGPMSNAPQMRFGGPPTPQPQPPPGPMHPPGGQPSGGWPAQARPPQPGYGPTYPPAGAGGPPTPTPAPPGPRPMHGPVPNGPSAPQYGPATFGPATAPPGHYPPMAAQPPAQDSGVRVGLLLGVVGGVAVLALVLIVILYALISAAGG